MFVPLTLVRWLYLGGWIRGRVQQQTREHMPGPVKMKLVESDRATRLCHTRVVVHGSTMLGPQARRSWHSSPHQGSRAWSKTPKPSCPLHNGVKGHWVVWQLNPHSHKEILKCNGQTLPKVKHFIALASVLYNAISSITLLKSVS